MAWPGLAGAVPYAKIVQLEASFAATPLAERDKLLMHILIVHADPANHTQIHAWVTDGPTRIDIPLSPDGALPDQPRQDWIDRNLDLHTDQPKGSVQTDVELLIRPPGGQTLPIPYLLAALAQAQKAVTRGAREMGGYLATFAAPHLNAITLTPTTCCTATATIPGHPVLTQDKTGKIKLPLATLTANPTATITLSTPIQTIDPTSD